MEEYQNGTMQLITGEIPDRILVERLYRDIAHVYTYEDYLNIVDEQAEMISDFLFSKVELFQRNIIRTVRDFDPHGINCLCQIGCFFSMTFPMTDIFMLLACLYIV